jgi:nitroreductase
MDIVEAVNSRKSIRAFKPDPVPQDILKEIIGLAQRAPSATNTQPCEFVIVSGRELEEIRSGLIKKVGEEISPDITGPKTYPEPYNTRRHAAIGKTHEIKGIQREDKEKRRWWEIQQLTNFGAPCEIYICVDRSFYFQDQGVNAWLIFDCGLIAENILLLATSYGLGTIVQARATVYPDVLRKVLGIPDSKLIMFGIAIGYPDWDDAINQFRSVREPLEKITKWYGFDLT